MYIKIIDDIPKQYSLGKLRLDYPNTSFPKNPSESLLEEFGVFLVNVSPKPTINSKTHYLKLSGFYQVDGKWQAHYDVVSHPKYLLENQARNERDNLLAQSDWIVVKSYEKGIPVPQDWVEYRQKLRDLPSQPNFPYEIDWPVSP